jgi:hypothetical protein
LFITANLTLDITLARLPERLSSDPNPTNSISPDPDSGNKND